MAPAPPRIFTPPNPSTIPFDPRSKDLRDAAGLAADAAAATYYQSKLIQPPMVRIQLNGADGIYEVNDDWTGSFNVQSISLLNVASFPIYIGNAPGAVQGGVPFPPDALTRMPLSGQAGSFVVAADPTDLDTDSVTVFLFRWALPD